MISLYESNITDILPDVFRTDPKVQALSYALSRATQRLIDYSTQISVFATIYDAPEEVVDLLAIELQTPYYDVTLPLDRKRSLVANTLTWYTHAGTAVTLNELITSVFGTGDIIEWWQEEDADPYTFKIRTEAPMTGDEVAEFSAMVKKIISIRSHLTAVEFERTTSGECYIGSVQSGYTVSADIREGGI